MARRKKGELWSNQKHRDLRIADATPEQVAKALMLGGAKPRPETRRRDGLER